MNGQRSCAETAPTSPHTARIRGRFSVGMSRCGGPEATPRPSARGGGWESARGQQGNQTGGGAAGPSARPKCAAGRAAPEAPSLRPTPLNTGIQGSRSSRLSRAWATGADPRPGPDQAVATRAGHRPPAARRVQNPGGLPALGPKGLWAQGASSRGWRRAFDDGGAGWAGHTAVQMAVCVLAATDLIRPSSTSVPGTALTPLQVTRLTRVGSEETVESHEFSAVRPPPGSRSGTQPRSARGAGPPIPERMKTAR